MQRRFISILMATLALVAALGAAGMATMPRALAQSGCTYAARLVAQTVQPDTSPLAPGATFTVTWTLRNDGTCTWTDAVRLVLASGDRLGSARTVRLTTDVAPAASAAVTLAFTAPDEPGSYAAVWRLRDPDGQRFGPQLAVEIEVGAQAALTDEVILPEVLVFGGRGGSGGDGLIDACMESEDRRFVGPGFVLNDEYIAYRHASLHLCGFDAGAELTLTLTNPEGVDFVHRYTVPEALTFTDARGRDYTQTTVTVRLRWPDRAPDGDWSIYVTDGNLEAEGFITVPPYEPLPPSEFGPFPALDNWPEDPIDPILAAKGCTYSYMPGQALIVAGKDLPASTRLPLGLYQERNYDGYLIASDVITTAADGSFSLRLRAPAEPGHYYLVTAVRLMPEGYQEGDEAYELGYGDETAQSCLTVLPEPGAAAWRLALIHGLPGSADVMALDMYTGAGAYPTYTRAQCDATDPAWWPDGEWLVYASNCVAGPPDEFGSPTQVAGSYDLYAVAIDFDWEEAFADTSTEPLTLTLTPEYDETEPHVDADGWIVYRRAAAGTPADQDGDLYVLDPFEEEFYNLGERGRAPVWSPDGSRIAFMSARSGSWQIYVLDLQSGEVTRISTGCTTHCRFPAWSPDGERLIYSMAQSRRDLTPNGLWIAPANGRGRPRQWLAGAYGRPAWSATGWIAFNGVDGIYRARADARPPVAERYLYNRPDSPPYWAPAWSR